MTATYQARVGVDIKGRRFEAGEEVTVRPPRWMVAAGHIDRIDVEEDEQR